MDSRFSVNAFAELREGKGLGQASLEFLILLAAFMSFLFAWVFVLQGVREKGEEAFSKSFAELALGDLQAAGNEVCLAGDGSVKKVEVSLWNPARMEGQGSFIILSSLNFSSFRKLGCPASASVALNKNAIVRVENQGGTVIFKS